MHTETLLERAPRNERLQLHSPHRAYYLVPRHEIIRAAVYAPVDDAAAPDTRADACVRDDAKTLPSAARGFAERGEVPVILDFGNSSEYLRQLRHELRPFPCRQIRRCIHNAIRDNAGKTARNGLDSIAPGALARERRSE